MVLGGALALLGNIGLLAHLMGIIVNVTPSLPMGLWREHPFRGALRRGVVVTICPKNLPVFREALKRGYLFKGDCPSGVAPLLKPVEAVAGDTVTISARSVSINGVALQHCRIFAADSHHRPLPRIAPGVYRVQPGEVWLISTFNPYSFDSRYFGPVPIQWIRGTATPLWVQAGPPRIEGPHTDWPARPASTAARIQ